MTVVSHVIRRSVVPIGLGLAVIVALLAALSVVPARATPETFNLDRSQSPMSARPTGPLQIPIGTAPSKIDGFCSTDPAGGEWNDALAVQFQDYDGVGRYDRYPNSLLETRQCEIVCLHGWRIGTDERRFASVYLDTLDTTQALAGPTDYALHVSILSTVRYRASKAPASATTRRSHSTAGRLPPPVALRELRSRRILRSGCR